MRKFNIKVNGVAYEVEVEEVNGASVSAAPVAPAAAPVKAAASAAPAAPKAAPVAGGEKVTAPMPGNILAVNVQTGAKVKKGDVLFILEAMKMENEIMASKDGQVAQVLVTKGATVETGAVLCVLN